MKYAEFSRAVAERFPHFTESGLTVCDPFHRKGDVKKTSFVSSDRDDAPMFLQYFSDLTKPLGERILQGAVYFGENAQGPPGFVHGGASASVLDEVLGALCWLNKISVVTSKIEVEYKRPIHIQTLLEWKVAFASHSDKKVHLSGTIFDPKDRKPRVMAQGSFAKVDPVIFLGRSKN